MRQNVVNLGIAHIRRFRYFLGGIVKISIISEGRGGRRLALVAKPTRGLLLNVHLSPKMGAF